MQGMEICRKYYEECGEPMLREKFPELLPYLAAGLCGSGSECFGFDDETSRDHDFEPGFLLFLPDESVIDRKAAFALERAYAKLPKEFMGLKRSFMQPVGGPRHGVMRIAGFFREKTGTPDGVLTAEQWLSVPSALLAEAVNGEIFYDGPGEVTRIREALSFYPEDIRKKKLAGHLLLMAQSGQYNFARCLAHGETGAAQLAVHEFVTNAIDVIFLLNKVYAPFYKWSFRALRDLPALGFEAPLLEDLMTSDNQSGNTEGKKRVIEGIAADVVEALMKEQLTKAVCQDLEKHAYSVNDGIADAVIRNLHILAGA